MNLRLVSFVIFFLLASAEASDIEIGEVDGRLTYPAHGWHWVEYRPRPGCEDTNNLNCYGCVGPSKRENPYLEDTAKRLGVSVDELNINHTLNIRLKAESPVDTTYQNGVIHDLVNIKGMLVTLEDPSDVAKTLNFKNLEFHNITIDNGDGFMSLPGKCRIHADSVFLRGHAPEATVTFENISVHDTGPGIIPLAMQSLAMKQLVIRGWKSERVTNPPFLRLSASDGDRIDEIRIEDSPDFNINIAGIAEPGTIGRVVIVDSPGVDAERFRRMGAEVVYEERPVPVPEPGPTPDPVPTPDPTPEPDPTPTPEPTPAAPKKFRVRAFSKGGAVLGWSNRAPVSHYLIALKKSLKIYPNCAKGTVVPSGESKYRAEKLEKLSAYNAVICAVDKAGKISEPTRLKFKTP